MPQNQKKSFTDTLVLVKWPWASLDDTTDTKRGAAHDGSGCTRRALIQRMIERSANGTRHRVG
ncbi:hypothetical protein SARC_08179 [Sphaeroforma arctica JP610]|uniref:Uncharacterized protein n=1 Tax=Sphaeroforma arctica JP610 TaxID=667725 RepID=A0A0L0FRM7_9EUKA|nr:hypothetical protein SARC_08179 [Sphaeroforma arctica JP610]KNC79425.1 hypothetical protein SARC_08179 [Sphaeroforma arctica JP610]|eukprot:XP_014153327.1 hypothetical protein SARC_08179 [Sphaeroforma arctica JP610]